MLAKICLKPENVLVALEAFQSKSSLYLFIIRVCWSIIACSNGAFSLYDPGFKYWPSHNVESSCKHKLWLTFNDCTVTGATVKSTVPASFHPHVVPVCTTNVSESKFTFWVPLIPGQFVIVVAFYPQLL